MLRWGCGTVGPECWFREKQKDLGYSGPAQLPGSTEMQKCAGDHGCLAIVHHRVLGSRLQVTANPIERSLEVHFVLLAVHNADVCPTSNSKTRELLLKTAPEIPSIAERAGVKIVAGPYVNREHTTVVIVEAERSEDVDRFLVETRLPQWNSVRVLPSLPMEEGIKEVQEQTPLF